jgi:hypothetical protein
VSEEKFPRLSKPHGKSWLTSDLKPPRLRRLLRPATWWLLLTMIALLWTTCLLSGCVKKPRSLLLEDQIRDPVAEGCVCGALPMNQYDMIGLRLFSGLDSALKGCGKIWTTPPFKGSDGCHCPSVPAEKFEWVDHETHMTANEDLHMCRAEKLIHQVQE